MHFSVLFFGKALKMSKLRFLAFWGLLAGISGKRQKKPLS